MLTYRASDVETYANMWGRRGRGLIVDATIVLTTCRLVLAEGRRMPDL